jgi:hypothetical protein
MIDFFTDLKSYFSQGSSGSSLSTHVSVVVAIVEDVPLEENVSPSVEHDEEEEQVQEGITDFNPDHIISDLGLRIPIERFYANIRDEVRRAFIAKGPTQPTGHRFPPPSDKRSFQKKWFSQYSWLEYSVEKGLEPVVCLSWLLAPYHCEPSKLALHQLHLGEQGDIIPLMRNLEGVPDLLGIVQAAHLMVLVPAQRG